MKKQNYYNLNSQDMINIKQKQYNNEIAKKTLKYQKQYGFDIGTGEHATWNNEADAFKHTFMSADLALEVGQIPSFIFGIEHENQTPNNPYGEWNMDSWNNAKGREIANEIKRDYGNNFQKFNKKERDNIIAEKVMQKMHNGELIISPNDSRKYNGWLENKINIYNKWKEGQTTGQAANIGHIYTREEIGRMTPEEFSQNEDDIMKQLSQGKIISDPYPNIKMEDYYPTVKIYTREEIGNMSPKEFKKHEKEIMKQMKTIGIPHKNQVPQNKNTSNIKKSTNSSSSSSANSTEEG